jgi:hypothetical protein
MKREFRMTYRGHVKNGQIVLDEPAQLPEGTAVNVLLESQPPLECSPSRETRTVESLLRKGIIRNIPRPPTAEDIASFNAWKPVKVEGKPVSETLIEDRR